MPHTEMSLKLREHERSEFPINMSFLTTQYTTGQILGGMFTIDNSNASSGAKGPVDQHGLSTILQSLSAYNPDSITQPAIDLFFFNRKPAGTFTDQATWGPSSADMQNCVGLAKIASTSWADCGSGGGFAGGPDLGNIGRVLKPAGAAQVNVGLNGSTALYMVPVIRATATFASGKLFIKLQFSHGL